MVFKLKHIALLLLLVPMSIKAQENKAVDTLYLSLLPEVEISKPLTAEELRVRRWMKYKVVKVYPYVQYIEDLLAEIDHSIDSLDKKRHERKYIRNANKELNDQFNAFVKDLSVSQGQVLCKLVYRQTGMTVYDIIHDYQSGAKALMWQGLARTGGADLKLTYDPENNSDDAIIEGIVLKVEKGEYAVKSIEEILATNSK